jgi:hypothetical protein
MKYSMAKKKIDENSVLSELSSSSFFSTHGEDESDFSAQQSDISDNDKSVDNIVDSSIDESADLSTDEPTGRQNDKQTHKETDVSDSQPNASLSNKVTTSTPSRKKKQQFDNSVILSRPKSFYITKKQDADIDVVVDKLSDVLEGKIAHKVDRSLVARLILESSDWTSDDAIDKLAKHLVDKLVSQLVD